MNNTPSDDDRDAREPHAEHGPYAGPPAFDQVPGQPYPTEQVPPVPGTSPSWGAQEQGAWGDDADAARARRDVAAGTPTASPATPPALDATAQYPQPGDHPGATYPGGSYPGAAYPGAQYPTEQYPGGQYPGGQYSGGQFPGAQHPTEQYPGGSYAGAPGAYSQQPTSGYGPVPTYYPYQGQYSGQNTGQYGYQPSSGPYGQPYGNPHYWAPPAPGTGPYPGGNVKPRQRKVLIGSVAAGASVALIVGAIAVGVERANSNSSSQTAVTSPNAQNGTGATGGSGSTGNGGTGNGGQFGWTNPFSGGSGNGFGGSTGSGSGSGSASTATQATATQSVGVVDVNTVLDYGTGKAAGTGMVLTSDGEILTNNHVVDGSTSISVVVISTGKTYTATVVGTDPTDDVAVLKLQNASGLATAKIGDSSSVKVADKVTAVGNAGGTGGTPSAAAGSVTALDQSITASDSDGSNSENLTGMIQVDADIQAGDSGGPLYDSAGEIIGIDTAASSSQSSATVGFAIPINKALTIAKQISSGTESSTIHQGYPAFLGVQLSAAGAGTTGGTTAGVPVAGVVSGSAAQKAGIAQGDTITSVDGTSVTSATALSALLEKKNPGDSVSVSWTDSSGQSHTATVTLGSGPAN